MDQSNMFYVNVRGIRNIATVEGTVCRLIIQTEPKLSRKEYQRVVDATTNYCDTAFPEVTEIRFNETEGLPEVEQVDNLQGYEVAEDQEAVEDPALEAQVNGTDNEPDNLDETEAAENADLPDDKE